MGIPAQESAESCDSTAVTYSMEARRRVPTCTRDIVSGETAPCSYLHEVLFPIAEDVGGEHGLRGIPSPVDLNIDLGVVVVLVALAERVHEVPRVHHPRGVAGRELHAEGEDPIDVVLAGLHACEHKPTKASSLLSLPASSNLLKRGTTLTPPLCCFPCRGDFWLT